MKTSLHRLRRCGLTLAALASLLAAPPLPGAEESGSSIVIRTPYSPGAGAGFSVSFPEAMVTAQDVGKPVRPELLPQVTPAIGLEGIWDSTSSITLRPKGEFTPRCIYEFRIPAGWKSLAGNGLPAADAVHCEGAYGYITHSATDEYDPESPILFCAREAGDEAAIADAVGKAWYSILSNDNGSELARLPAKVRPATVGDILAHWELYSHMATLDNAEAERRAFAALPPDTPLRGTWLAEGCLLDSPDERAVLKLPGLGSFDRDKRRIEDADIESKRLHPYYHIELHSRRLAQGSYRVSLASTHPVAATDPSSALAACDWYISMVGGERPSPALGKLLCEGDTLLPSPELLARYPELAGLRLTLDREASAASLKRQALRSGGDVAGLTRLVLKAEVGKNLLRLRCVPTIPSAYGEAADEDWGSPDKEQWIESSLTPPQPQLACSVMSAGLREGGRRQILYRTLHVDSVTARVYRTEATGANPLRVLRAYCEQYTPLRYATASWEEEKKLRQQEPTLFQPGGLPCELVQKELPANEERAMLDPSSFFPGAPAHGMYIIELEGKPSAAEWQPRKVVAQGLVQVTDLGLMWKSSAGSLFAYAYRLSDATALAEGTLHVLDAEGQELACLAVKDGIARGTLPQDAACLQLRSGDDAYTCFIRSGRFYNEHEGSYFLRMLDLEPGEFPRTLTCLFADRMAYRPGETMHIKGIVRSLKGDELSTPELESVCLELEAGGVRRELPATLHADGSFTASIPLDGCAEDSSATLTPRLTFKGDAEGNAPDQQALQAKGIDKGKDDARYLLQSNRRGGYLSFIIADFLRNEFEIDADLRAEGSSVHMDARATAFTGLPVARGQVEWVVQRTPLCPAPAQYPDFCFGDFRSSYFVDGDFYRSTRRTRLVQSLRGELDSEGRGALHFELPPAGFPGRSRVSVSASVTNGNAQTLRCTRHAVVEGSAVYAGLKPRSLHSGPGSSIELDAVLVQADESGYEGAPIPCTVEVTHRRFYSYRYGAEGATSLRSVPEEQQVYSGTLAVGGTPVRLTLPSGASGIYDIVLRGKDAAGKPFASALCHYVWGGAEAPWELNRHGALQLVPDKVAYAPGETAQLLLQTPVSGEVLVTIERGGVRRELRRRVTVDKPVIDIPLVEGDGPVAYVSCFLVQAPDGGRDASGLPRLSTGTVPLKVDVPEKHLTLELHTPQESTLAQQEWTVGGRVLDAEGKPVAGAGVALYAVDEGTLQVTGYKLPDPYALFYGSRPCGVSTFANDYHFAGDDFDKAEFGNKGVFIGGGDGGEADSAAEAMPRVREDFTPCALWLGNARSDAEGRFTATYANPDTMTRYRLMAVADEGDRFGSGETSYSVLQPVMLEASAPDTVTQGDLLTLPVTVSMLPDALPEGKRGSAEWTVRLQAEGCQADACQTVTLKGGEAQTLFFTVRFGGEGSVQKLTWSVSSPEPELKGMGDAVALDVKLVPPTPRLRERFAVTVQPNAENWVNVQAWGKGSFRRGRQHITLSTSPLVGAAAGFDLLFGYPYGCLEQTASTLLPWLFRDELEQGVDLRFPEGAGAESRIREGRQSLVARLRGDGHFAYWDTAGPPSEFSPYALLVLGYVHEKERHYDSAYYSICRAENVMEQELRSSEGASLIGLLATVRHGSYSTDSIRAIIARHEKRSSAENWLVAAVARLAGMPEADELRALALRQEKSRDLPAGALAPPADVAKLLESVFRAPQDASTGSALRAYISEGVEQGRFRSTWEAGWLAILVHEYLSRQEAKGGTPRARVSGHTIEPGKPWRYSRNPAHTAGQYLYVNEGSCPLYAAGEVEGYLSEEQGGQLVDKGFRVERRYEKLMADGSWQPAAEFALGDTVRVTLRATGREGEKSRYFVLEDRLPSLMEVVNPDLPSQSLPQGLAAQRESAWCCPAWVDHREYGRDSVRFFASSWGSGTAALEASYIARVVRAGSACAPGAKAELMYRPQVYGLSVPQSLKATAGQ